MHFYIGPIFRSPIQSDETSPALVMFNATLAGHHLRADYAGSRGGSRQGSRYDLNEVGRFQVRIDVKYRP